MKNYALRMIWPAIMITVLAVASILGDHDKVTPTLFYSALGLAVCFVYMVWIDYMRAKQDLEGGYLETVQIQTLDEAMDTMLNIQRRLDKRDGVERTEAERLAAVVGNFRTHEYVAPQFR